MHHNLKSKSVLAIQGAVFDILNEHRYSYKTLLLYGNRSFILTIQFRIITVKYIANWVADFWLHESKLSITKSIQLGKIQAS